MAVIRQLPDWAIAFVLSLLSRNLLDSVLERKMSLGAIFVSKTETQLTFEHGAKRRRSKSPEQGVEDLSGGHRREALGGICLRCAKRSLGVLAKRKELAM